MNSSLYVGRVTHARKTPVEHRFVYPVLGLVLDPDELGRLNGEVRGFGYNRFNVVSVRDRDYLAGEGTVIGRNEGNRESGDQEIGNGIHEPNT